MPDDEIPEIKLDGHRQYWGKPQLNDQEISLLRRIKRAGLLQLVFTKSGPVYICNDKRVDKRVALRLIDHHYLIQSDRGLFGEPAQTWVTRPVEPTGLSAQLQSHLRRP
jgi:hypothetical protein